MSSIHLGIMDIKNIRHLLWILLLFIIDNNIKAQSQDSIKSSISGEKIDLPFVDFLINNQEYDDALLILNVEPRQKIIVFTHYINSFDTDDIQSLVTKLGSEYELLFESDKELKFENNQINFQLFSDLKAKELIKDFNQNKVEINVKTL